MSMIPTGNFGQQVAQPQRAAQGSADAFGAGVGQATEALGRTGMAVAAQKEQQLQQEQARIQQEKESLARAKAGNAMLDYEVGVAGIVDGLQEEIRTGKLDYSKAPEVFQQRLNEYKPADIADLDPVGRENYDKGVNRIGFKYGKTLDGIVDVKRKDDAKAQFGIAIKNLRDISGLPGASPDDVGLKADAFGAHAKQSGLDSAYVDIAVTSLKEDAWANAAQQKMMSVNNSIDGLMAFEKELVEGAYAGKFDASRRLAMQSSAANRRLQLEGKAENEANRRETIAGRAFEEYQRQLASGYAPPAELMQSWADKARGTSYEGAMLKAMQTGQEMQQLFTKPIEQQLQYLTDWRTRMTKNGADLDEQANYNRYLSAVTANVKAMQEQPLLYDQQRNGNPHKPLDLTQLDSPEVAAQLSERVDALGALRAKHGPTVQNKPLLDHEADQLSTMLRQGSPQAQAQILGTLGKQIGDVQAFRGAVQQVAKGDPVMLAAGLAFANDYKTSDRRSVATIILEGQKVRADKSIELPKDKAGTDALRPVFNEYVGNAYPPGPAREASYQTFLSIYAGLSKQNGDLSANLNRQRALDAANIATGGVVNYNGQKVLVPYGMPEDKFTERVRMHKRAIARELKLPSEKALDDLPLIYTVDGRYMVGSGTELVRNKDGKPYLINPNVVIAAPPVDPKTIDKARQTSIMMRGF